MKVVFPYIKVIMINMSREIRNVEGSCKTAVLLRRIMTMVENKSVSLMRMDRYLKLSAIQIGVC